MDQIKRGLLFFVVGILCLAAARPVQAGFSGLNGFVEFDYGARFTEDTTKQDGYNLFEQRLQLKSSYFFEGEHYLADKAAVVDFKGDAWVDWYFGGKTGFDLREFNLALTPYDIMDVKIGRQVLTWGTGDYLFINDQFPKDYVSLCAALPGRNRTTIWSNLPGPLNIMNTRCACTVL